jgi:hypothetical protein
MNPVQRQYLRTLLEADDGTIVDGDDVALNRDVNDPRLTNVRAQLKELSTTLRAAFHAIRQFQRTSEVLVILPENDPRRLGGTLAEIDIDASTIAQACERLQPRLKTAMELVGPGDDAADSDWI